jgi:hypothetical protein
MALSDLFLSPVGLLALLAVVPVVVLYLVRPDPRRVDLPTLRLLVDEEGEDASNPLLERLTRSLLLLLQLSVLVAFAVALAGPYVSVSESRTVEETVVVLDGSASMGVETGDGTRFEAAVAAARESATNTNAVVVAGGESRVVLRSGGADEAATALDGLRASHAPTDLGAAVSQAAALAGENARVVVFSDFAGDAWVDDVQSARARNLRVDLRQFAGGGGDNVGIVGRSFSGRNVTLVVKNYGAERATRSVTLGDRSRSVALDPGSARRVELPVPPAGGEARLTPSDSFPVDDTAYVAGPPEPTVDALLLTNDPSRHLTTALSVVEEVRLTVDSPPTTVEDGYDVILYGDVDAERLLRGNVAAGRDVVDAGGGVAVLAQGAFPETYGDLLLVSSEGVGVNPAVGRVASDELTRGIDFPPPEEYHRGSVRSGRALVETGDGAPLLATARRGPGRLLYYGYVTENDPFRFNYQYPVFWKRAVFHLAGRESLDSLNRASGTLLRFDDATAVRTPAGRVEGRTVRLDRTGFYLVDGERRVGVSLYSDAESDVDAASLDDRAAETGVRTREEERRVPRPLTPVVALLALALVVSEVAYLRRRGDL